jgi:hypothetical protein
LILLCSWALDSPLEIVIPARSTPWTDMPKGRPSRPHLPSPLLEAVTPVPTPSRRKGGNRVRGRDSKLKHLRHRQDPLKGKVADDRRNSGSSHGSWFIGISSQSSLWREDSKRLSCSTQEAAYHLQPIFLHLDAVFLTRKE